MIIYIAHPLRGSEVKNRRRVSDILRELDRDYPEHLFLSPIHTFSWLGEDHDRALTLCRRLIAQADELWLFGDWRHSKGCLIERREAKRLGISVFEVIKLEVK